MKHQKVSPSKSESKKVKSVNLRKYLTTPSAQKSTKNKTEKSLQPIGDDL